MSDRSTNTDGSARPAVEEAATASDACDEKPAADCMDEEAPKSGARNLAWGEDMPATSSSTSTATENGGPSRFFLEALKAARLRRPEASSSVPIPCDESPGSDAASASAKKTPSYADTETISGARAVEDTTEVAGTSSLPKRTPAPPKAPRTGGRPRSAMAALAGAALAKGNQVSCNVAEATNSPLASNDDCPSAATNKDAVVNTSSLGVAAVKDGGRAGASDGKSISGAKPGARDFVDPRLERLHFLQAVQRMRAQVSEPQDGDTLAQKVSADLMSSLPQRPQSAVARLHMSEKEDTPKAVADKIDDDMDRHGAPVSTCSWT